MGNSNEITLEGSLKDLAVLHGEKMNFWRLIHRSPDTLFFSMSTHCEDSYVLRLKCDNYFDEPIKGQFVDANSFELDANAWPQGNGTFGGWIKWQPSNLFICWPGDREALNHHKDWRAKEFWKQSKNPLHQYLEFIRKCLNIKTYGYQPKSQASLVA